MAAKDRFGVRYGGENAAIDALIKEGEPFTEKSIWKILQEIRLTRVRDHIRSLRVKKKILDKTPDGYILKKAWESALN